MSNDTGVKSFRQRKLSESDEEESKEIPVPPKKRKGNRGQEFDNNSNKSISANKEFIDRRRKLSESDEDDNKNLPKKWNQDNWNQEFDKNSINSASVIDEAGSANAYFDNPVVAKMMNKMGHKTGKGLGAKLQGRSEPVATEMRLGRAGLGAKKTGLEPNFEVTWDSSQENVDVEETVDWMPECQELPPLADDMQDWIVVGQRVGEIDNQVEFCSPEALRDMLQAKTVFDELNDRDLRHARTRANPFESIKGAFFQNRAAMKMANLDAIFSFELTDPKNEKGESVVPKNGSDLFYFADVCAGPGGFTEYMLWKRNEYSAHGFGFTLRGKDDFKLDNFLASSPEYFEPYYGISGKEGDGDVMNPVNLENFRNLVMKVTNDKGIHLFMADGGFSVEGQENIQEILSKRLYLCQILCAFNILAEGGNLICKLFDVFTPFSAGLLYLMWRSFNKVCLHKPHTSRPANSERYVVCMGYRHDCQGVREYLKKINLEYEKIQGDKNLDVLEIVPLSILRESPDFCQYLTQSNDKMARRQTLYLDKYKAFARNKMLEDHRQHDVRAKCLLYWAIPDDRRPERPHVAPMNRFTELCEDDTQWIHQPGSSIEDAINETTFLEYRFAVVSNHPVIVLALGRQSFIWDGHSRRWEFMDRTVNLNLPKDTLVLGEFSTEFKDGQGKNQQRLPILRIFDAFILNGKNISDLPYRDRLSELRKFCLATSREHSRPDTTIARTAEVFKLSDLRAVSMRIDKGNVNRAEKLVFKSGDGSSYFEFKKLLFLQIVREPWKISWSKSQNQVYFYNVSTKASLYGGKEPFADFKMMYSSRRIWTLPQANQPDVAKESFMNFVNVIKGKQPKHQ